MNADWADNTQIILNCFEIIRVLSVRIRQIRV